MDCGTPCILTSKILILNCFARIFRRRRGNTVSRTLRIAYRLFFISPVFSCLVAGWQVQVPRAEQIRATVTHLELQLVQVSEAGRVVAGEAVAAHILRPGARQPVPSRAAPHLAPVPQPLRRADALRGRAAGRALQKPQQRWQQRHGARPARLAVLRRDENPLARQIHIAPAQPRYLVRANPRIQHQPHRRQTNAAAVFLRRVHQLLRLLRCQNLDAFLLHARSIHPRHRVLAAPAALHRRGEHPAERQPRLLSLPGCLKSRLNIRRTLRRSDAPHPPFRQPGAALHEAPHHIAEIAERPRPPVLPRLQSRRHRFFERYRLFLQSERLFPLLQAPQCSLHSSSARPDGGTRYLRRFQKRYFCAFQ